MYIYELLICVLDIAERQLKLHSMWKEIKTADTHDFVI